MNTLPTPWPLVEPKQYFEAAKPHYRQRSLRFSIVFVVEISALFFAFGLHALHE